MKRHTAPWLLCWLLASLLLIGSPPGLAVEPSGAPFLRIDTDMHTGRIHKIAVDHANGRLVTVADDKTLRLWRLPDLRLLATYRVPIGAGNEGQLFAVTVSPDGKTIAAGGWTGWNWDRRGAVYLFDIESGKILHRLDGFANVIGALKFSVDGSFLAVGLQGKGGLAIFRSSDYRQLKQDSEYEDKILGMDFDRRGHLVVCSLDGLVRMYDQDFNLYGRKRFALGAKPGAVRFSPSGTAFAVGFYDAPKVAIVSTRNMRLLSSPTVQAPREQKSLAVVAWSLKGRRLCAGGDYLGDGQNAIYCWSNEGKGNAIRIPVAAQGITDLDSLASGEVAFGAADPAIGLIKGAEGQKIVRGPELIDYSSATLRISNDASLIEFPLQPDAKATWFFSVNDQDDTPDPKIVAQLRRPVWKSKALLLDNWKDHYRPSINGKAIALEKYEISRCYAYSPDGKSLLLGTQWALRLLDAGANQRWMVPLTSVARAVNVSPDGTMAVAALSDGTIRWYRMDDGGEILALFVHPANKEWIAWTPQGYYMSSAQGDNYVGWHVNRGKEGTPDFYRAVQFERLLYRPDLVLAFFRSKGIASESPGQSSFFDISRFAKTAPRRLQIEPVADGKSKFFDISRFAEIAPPRVQIESVAIGEQGAPAVLRISAQKVGLPMQDYTVFVNMIPVTTARDRVLRGAERAAFSRQLEIDLPATENEVRVEVFNGTSMGVSERLVVARNRKPATAPKAANLYMLAVGAGEFMNLPKKFRLAYPARDAEEIARQFQQQGAGLYRNVYVKVLSDLNAVKPDREKILGALEFIKDARAGDTVVIFLASHGISDVAGNYYFVPHDADLADVENVLRGRAPEGTSLLSWTVFFDALRGTAGKRLLVVDTCQANNIVGTLSPHALAKRSASSLFALMVASRGGEDSQEYPPKQHGLFTHSLLSGLSGAADIDGDGVVNLDELFEYALPVVTQLHNAAIGPQTPQLVAPTHLLDMPLTRAQGSSASR